MGVSLIELDSVRKEFRINAPGRRALGGLLGQRKTLTVTALAGLSLSVEQGCFYSLLGPNGAGKTTAIKILCTLLLPDAGTARVAGLDVVRQDRDVRARIGVSIRGERSVYWKLTGRQNLEYFASLYGFRGEHAHQRISETVEVIGLAERIDDYVERYSMGMKQRLAIGCAILHRPPILFLDEPTIGLDPVAGRSLRTFIRDELCRQNGTTVLYTTHYMYEAEELSDRVAIVHHGRLLAEGTPLELRENLHQYRIFEAHVGALAPETLAVLNEHPLIERITSQDSPRGGVEVRIQTRDRATPITPLVEILTRDGGELHALHVVRPTLEDVFVTLTGGTLSEAGDVSTVG